MAWNIFMHVLIGLLGTQHFTLTMQGLLWSLLVVAFTQASDLIRVHSSEKKKIEALPANERDAKMKAFREALPAFLVKIFAKNLFYYTLLVLLSAEVGRST